MIDTTRILASVAAARTTEDSVLELLAGQSQAMKDLSQQLKDAIAANDPAAMAQVQADLDAAANDLDAEQQKAKDAIAANNPNPPQP